MKDRVRKHPPKIAERFRKPKTTRKVQIALALKPSLIQALIDLAQMSGRNRTNLIERLIIEEAARQKVKLNASLDDPES